jgi:hypothetical protein
MWTMTSVCEQAWVLKKSVPLRAFGGLNPAFDLVGTTLTGYPARFVNAIDSED